MLNNFRQKNMFTLQTKQVYTVLMLDIMALVNKSNCNINDKQYAALTVVCFHNTFNASGMNEFLNA